METALAIENSSLEIDATVTQNSRLDFPAVFPGMHPASVEAKPKNASGIGDEVRREGIQSRSTGKERDAETGLDFFGAWKGSCMVANPSRLIQTYRTG